MKRTLGGLLFGLLAAASASAQIVMFDFTGMINSTRENNRLTGRSLEVPGSSLNGTFVVPGNTFRGSFTLDLATPSSSSSSNQTIYRHPTSWNLPRKADTNAMTFTVDQSGFTYNSAMNTVFQTNIFVTDQLPGTGGDSLSFIPSPTGQNSFYETTQLWLDDYTGSLFSSTKLPASIDFDALDSATFSYGYSPVDNKQKSLSVIGFLTSITVRAVSPVPEPSTYAMLALGLLTIGAAGYRQKRHRSDIFHA